MVIDAYCSQSFLSFLVLSLWGGGAPRDAPHLVLLFAVRVRAPRHCCNDAHGPWEPERPISGPPSRYDAKAEIDR